MTEGERMVWAAAYAAERARQREERTRLGIPPHYYGRAEEAWAAVAELRETVLQAAIEGCGDEQDEIVRMVKEMIG